MQTVIDLLCGERCKPRRNSKRLYYRKELDWQQNSTREAILCKKEDSLRSRSFSTSPVKAIADRKELFFRRVRISRRQGSTRIDTLRSSRNEKDKKSKQGREAC